MYPSFRSESEDLQDEAVFTANEKELGKEDRWKVVATPHWSINFGMLFAARVADRDRSIGLNRYLT
jgi:hypothetical protein